MITPSIVKDARSLFCEIAEKATRSISINHIRGTSYG